MVVEFEAKQWINGIKKASINNIDRRMAEQRSSCRGEDSLMLGKKVSVNAGDKVSIHSVEIRFTGQSRGELPHEATKQKSTFKLINSTDNRLYHEYLMLRQQGEIKVKMTHIFNIRSINLVEKHHQKNQQKQQQKHQKAQQQRHNSVEPKRRSLKENSEFCRKPCVQTNKLRIDCIEKRIQNMDKKNDYIQQKGDSPKRLLLLQKKSLNNFEAKLQQYIDVLKDTAHSSKLQLREVQSYTKNQVIVAVGKGNNAALVRQLLKKRWWLTLSEAKKDANFTWSQLKQKSYFQQVRGQQPPTLHNHFQCNEILGNKKALYYSMKAFYERAGKDAFDVLPVTFHVRRSEDAGWKAYVEYSEGKASMWIVKPGQNSNRGKGISVHDNVEDVRVRVEKELTAGRTLIIQQYLSRPMLYNGRKFDLRCYMLLTRLNGTIKGYWYEEGYVRTSCEVFQLGDCTNEFVHLTNDAVQVNSDKYGKYEMGNKLTFQALQKYIDATEKNSFNIVRDLCPQLKNIATEAMQGGYSLLGQWRNPTFQVFGLDFMIDEDYKPWLIEINTNPCLDTSSPTLQRVIPRMLDNAFRLSLDVMYPPPLNWPHSRRHFIPNRTQNMFQLVFQEPAHLPAPPLEIGDVDEDIQVYEQDD